MTNNLVEQANKLTKQVQGFDPINGKDGLAPPPKQYRPINIYQPATKVKIHYEERPLTLIEAIGAFAILFGMLFEGIFMGKVF